MKNFERTRCLVLLCACFISVGCVGPISDSNDFVVPDEVQRFCESYRDAICAEDWAQLQQLHLPSAEATVESFESLFAPVVKHLGESSTVTVSAFRKMDKSNFTEYWEPEDLSGAVDTLMGEVEIHINGEEENSIYVWAFLGKENGQVKIQTYIELSTD